MLLALSVTLACSLIIGLVYRTTNTTAGYSQSYVQTLVMTSLVTALIMVVIGSNLARAFSLVGALSIVRFRNAVKETRDVGYIFFSLAVAMAAGTRFFGIAVAATLFICLTALCLHYFSFGVSKTAPERVLKVRLAAGSDPMDVLGDVLGEYFTHFTLVVAETVRQGMYLDAVFSVRQKAEVKTSEILSEIAKVNKNLKIVYRYDNHQQDL